MTDSKPTDYVSIPLIKIEGADPLLLDEFKRDILQSALKKPASTRNVYFGSQ
jgi:hypothetical protein